ncbi:hypothetical protein AYI70_g10406, partial [Smittium culicis]
MRLTFTDVTAKLAAK